MHYTEQCKCKNRYCEHYRSDFDEYLEENKIPNLDKIQSVIKDKYVGENEYFTKYRNNKL
jgi:hypothetical protein